MPYPVGKLRVLSKSIWSLPLYPSNPLHFKRYSNIHTSSYSSIPHTSPCPLSLLSASDPIPRWAATSKILLDFFFTFTPTPSLLHLFLQRRKPHCPYFSLSLLCVLYINCIVLHLYFVYTYSTVWRAAVQLPFNALTQVETFLLAFLSFILEEKKKKSNDVTGIVNIGL